MDLGQWLIIIFSVLMGAWYVVGSIINRRRGIATYRWLHAGLEKYGKISEAKWIGSAASGARMAVDQPAAPFRRIETVFLLDSLEILPLWLFNLVRKKTDEMVLKANLRKPPTYQLEVARPGKLNMEKINAQVGQSGSVHQEQVAGLSVALWGKVPSNAAAASAGFLTRYGPDILTLSLRRASPHLIVKVKLPNLTAAPAEFFLETLESWLRGELHSEPNED